MGGSGVGGLISSLTRRQMSGKAVQPTGPRARSLGRALREQRVCMCQVTRLLVAGALDSQESVWFQIKMGSVL